jgi:hypothetical protein
LFFSGTDEFSLTVSELMRKLGYLFSSNNYCLGAEDSYMHESHVKKLGIDLNKLLENEATQQCDPKLYMTTASHCFSLYPH